MSKTIVLPLAVEVQSPSHDQFPMLEESPGFEQVGTIMNRLMTNLAWHGDMFYGEDHPQRQIDR